jgi:hypothetical protein
MEVLHYRGEQAIRRGVGRKPRKQEGRVAEKLQVDQYGGHTSAQTDEKTKRTDSAALPPTPGELTTTGRDKERGLGTGGRMDKIGPIPLFELPIRL